MSVGTSEAGSTDIRIPTQQLSGHLLPLEAEKEQEEIRLITRKSISNYFMNSHLSFSVLFPRS